MTSYYLGIDTSAYTTSIGVIDEQNNVICNERKILEVKKGSRGLRQQEAIFQHMLNFPVLMERVSEKVDFEKIVSVSASVKPRDREDSYMPVFLFGEGQAILISKLLGAKYLPCSHQEGHIGSILISDERPGDFLAIHISGGTTEILRVANGKKLAIDLIGGTKDISIGQLLDRVGVKMGLGFPAGKEMDSISRTGNTLDLKLSKSISGNWINLSGVEAQLYRAIDSERYRLADISKTLFIYIAELLEKLISKVAKEQGISRVYLVGGVSSNKTIRQVLIDYSKGEDIELLFPEVELSADNGVGVAYIGKREMES
jgi:N6-L-threonylcarbamoyladenine synthase